MAVYDYTWEFYAAIVLVVVVIVIVGVLFFLLFRPKKDSFDRGFSIKGGSTSVYKVPKGPVSRAPSRGGSNSSNFSPNGPNRGRVNSSNVSSSKGDSKSSSFSKGPNTASGGR